MIVTSTAQNCRLGAAYVYTTLAAAKYICQFLDSPLSFVNHIPTSLLCKCSILVNMARLANENTS